MLRRVQSSKALPASQSSAIAATTISSLGNRSTYVSPNWAPSHISFHEKYSTLDLYRMAGPLDLSDDESERTSAGTDAQSGIKKNTAAPVAPVIITVRKVVEEPVQVDDGKTWTIKEVIDKYNEYDGELQEACTKLWLRDGATRAVKQKMLRGKIHEQVVLRADRGKDGGYTLVKQDVEDLTKVLGLASLARKGAMVDFIVNASKQQVAQVPLRGLTLAVLGLKAKGTVTLKAVAAVIKNRSDWGRQKLAVNVGRLYRAPLLFVVSDTVTTRDPVHQPNVLALGITTDSNLEGDSPYKPLPVGHHAAATPARKESKSSADLAGLPHRVHQGVAQNDPHLTAPTKSTGDDTPVGAPKRQRRSQQRTHGPSTSAATARGSETKAAQRGAQGSVSGAVAGSQGGAGGEQGQRV